MKSIIMSIASALIPLFAIAIGLAQLAGVIYYLKQRERKQARNSPLTRKLLRPAGYSLRVAITDHSEQMLQTVAILLMTPLLIFVAHICQSYFGHIPESPLRIAVSSITGLGLTMYFSRLLLRQWTDLKYKSLGLDGELATAEELNQLMLDGCRVFHDIPIKYGNIDHVVVSHSGVFSVNSKLLGKLKDGEGGSEITVDHDRGIIRFPDREYRIPVQQFETEASCLSKHLTSSVGQSIKVEPMLALPGWCVKERIGRGSVFVINPYKPKKFFVHNRQVLSPALVQQVAHQLEQLCRDLEPVHQEKRERWEDKS